MEDCQYHCTYENDHKQTNALRVEILDIPKDRCRLKQPEHMKRFDPTGFRWIASGGTTLHFGRCTYPKCPPKPETEDGNA